MINRRTLLKAMGASLPLTLIPTAHILANTRTETRRFAMVIDVRRCTGCLSCSVACAIENGTPKGMNRNQVRQFAVPQAEGFGTMTIPTQCGQCEKAPCVDVCPADATARNKNGIVYIDRDACVACQSCVAACPYGARAGDENGEVAPEKCDFCIVRSHHGLLPACVESCVGHARIFGDLNDPGSKLVQTIKDNDVYAMLPKAETRPSLFYIGLPGATEDQKILNLNYLNWQR